MVVVDREGVVMLAVLLTMLSTASACESDADCTAGSICDVGACIDPAVVDPQDAVVTTRLGRRFVIGDRSYTWSELKEEIGSSGNAAAIDHAHKASQMTLAGSLLLGASGVAFGLAAVEIGIGDESTWPMAMAGGGAFLLTGSILLAVAPGQRERAARALVDGRSALVLPAVSRDGASVVVIGRF